MDTAGQKLKRERERLKLRYRDVEEASQQLAERLGNAEYAIALSRLSDIENKGTVPTIYRLYSLCTIYRLAITEVLRWYGVCTEGLVGDITHVPLDVTHLMRLRPDGGIRQPGIGAAAGDFNRDQTTFLGKALNWGRLGSSLLSGFEFKYHRLGFIGEQDRFMFPLLQPGSVVIIDERQRKIEESGWTSEYDRPIYFLETRTGYSCGWAAVSGEYLVVQPHPASARAPVIHRYPNEVEVVGRVVGSAVWISPRAHTRSQSEVSR